MISTSTLPVCVIGASGVPPKFSGATVCSAIATSTIRPSTFGSTVPKLFKCSAKFSQSERPKIRYTTFFISFLENRISVSTFSCKGICCNCIRLSILNFCVCTICIFICNRNNTLSSWFRRIIFYFCT